MSSEEVRDIKRRIERVLRDNGYRRATPGKDRQKGMGVPRPGYHFMKNKITYTSETSDIEALQQIYNVLCEHGFGDSLKLTTIAIYITRNQQSNRDKTCAETH